MSNLMSVQEVADYLGVSTKTVRRLQGTELPFTRIGYGRGQIRFSARDVVGYLKRNASGNLPSAREE